jgi:4-hydroxy-4-methyl-2-oxoglutarate aldolase
LELKYPVFSKESWMRTGKDRIQVEGFNVPITLGEARVQNGDILRGDADGVVVIPQEHEEAVLKSAEEINDAESRIRDAIRGGMRLDEARKQFKYHQLQTRQKS